MKIGPWVVLIVLVESLEDAFVGLSVRYFNAFFWFKVLLGALAEFVALIRC